MDGGLPFRMMLPFWEVQSELMPVLQDAAELNGLSFLKKKKCILLTTVCVTDIHLVIYVWRGRNGWMAADSVGCSCLFWNFQMRQYLVDF